MSCAIRTNAIGTNARLHLLRQMLLTGAVLVVASGGGCAAPGSALTQVELTGELRDRDGKPLAHRPLEICLPAGYGLRGLDARWGKPADYGHRDQWVTVITDGEGRFAHTFEPVSYSMLFWLVPPLGGGRPPKPVIGLRSRLPAGEWFIVYVMGDKTRALRWRENTEQRTPLPGLVGTPALTFRKHARAKPAGWTTHVVVTRPAG